MDVRFRSIPTWPYESTPAYNRKSRYTFKASLSATLDLLDRELHYLGAKDITIECGLSPSDIRLDGWPRSNARTPMHPGVALHFDTRSYGHLRYATDVFETWESNLRAIALGLEALRKVDRYGITKGGEQYRGFGELPPGQIAMGPASMSLEEAESFLIAWAEKGGVYLDSDDLYGGHLDSAYRAAAKFLHPDHGGDAEDFHRLQEAKRLLEGQGA